MKTTILSFMLLISFFNISQVQILKDDNKVVIGKITAISETLIEMTYNTDYNRFSITYRDCNYKYVNSYKTLSFADEGDTFNDFYKLLKSFFNDENKSKRDYSVTIGLDGKRVIISKYGRYMITIATEDGFFYLSNEQIDKLFSRTL